MTLEVKTLFTANDFLQCINYHVPCNYNTSYIITKNTIYNILCFLIPNYVSMPKIVRWYHLIVTRSLKVGII